jgi:S1-C subfamily serine protease
MVAHVQVSQRRVLGTLLRSVVKVNCVSDAPNYDQPWQSDGPTSSSGSGAIIDTVDGLRVLTNAHCVANHVFVEVRRYGLTQKFEAEVEGLGHECDLALLRIDDEAFYHGVEPIPIGPLPALSDRVSVCGFPVGGERLSITEGIVSRIELVSYAQSNRELLAVQIDAAINAGNSGGPVIDGGQLVGVAFQALDEAESVGYVIATPVVRHFLEDVANGVYEGFPALGAATQKLESIAHRRCLGLSSEQTHGVLVREVAHGGSAWGVLQPGDVLLAVDGVPVSADGTVELAEGLIDFGYVVARRHVGERMPVEIVRHGEPLHLQLVLEPPPYLVAEDRYDVRPSYFIYGGLLFVPLTRDYLKTWGDAWWQSGPRELVHLYENGLRSPGQSEVVVMQKVLADRVNGGYHDQESLVITHVGDVQVRDLAHLVALVESETAAFLRFRATDGTGVVLERQDVARRQQAVLRKFGVPSDRSLDLMRAKSLAPALDLSLPA